MTPRNQIFRKAAFPLALSLIPGWGHIWVHRPTRGLAIFLGFFAVLNVALVGLMAPSTGQSAPWVQPAIALAAAVFVFGFVDTLRITVWARGRTVQRRRKRLLWRAQVHYLKGEYGQSAEATRRMLRINPHDVQALIQSGLIQFETGNPTGAERLWTKARMHDRDQLWELEIERLLWRSSRDHSAISAGD